jgi:hypothetical protein
VRGALLGWILTLRHLTQTGASHLAGLIYG